MRVAIIGGGIGGVATAWFLNGSMDVHLFESLPRLGGNALTVSNIPGLPPTDLGACFFSPKSFPVYCQLLNYTNQWQHSVRVNTSLTIFKSHNLLGAPSRVDFISPHLHLTDLWPKRILQPLEHKSGLLAFGVLMVEGKRLMHKRDWNITIEDWIQTLHLSTNQKDLLKCYLSSTIGCSIEEGKGLSALSVLFYVTESLTHQMVPAPLYYMSMQGLQGNIEGIVRNCGSGVSIHMNTPIEAVVRNLSGPGYHLALNDGSFFFADHVIFACPPNISAEIIRKGKIPGSSELLRILDQFKFFSAHLMIHKDPIYMPTDRKMWSAVNAERGDQYCQYSMWEGGLRPFAHRVENLDIFKSWVNGRTKKPKQILSGHVFNHLLTTPNMISALNALKTYQGQNGLWFVGSHMGGSTTHESASQSAMAVASRLAYNAPKLQKFRWDLRDVNLRWL